MNYIIMGLPGVGKGTQADIITKEYNVVHLSTGNMFREFKNSETDLGKELAGYLDSGNLVPDELTIKLLKAEISKPEYENGFLLDGFPRNKEQAQFLDQLMVEMGKKIDKVIYLSSDEETVVKRISGRLTCPNCQATYHRDNIEGDSCLKCQTKLITREDDKPEKVRVRLKLAKEQTLPVIDFYKAKELVLTIETNDLSIEEVFNEIKAGLND